MNLTLEQMKDLVDVLPATEKAELVQYLVHSTDERELDEIQAEWIAVAKQRLEEMRSGRVVGIPAEEVLKNLLEPRK